ncbi:FAD-dependent oxidoreductase [Sporobolomyces salmoneus]|uniref:FAD-dependent oxidoreductase n=1 Tax=Sporobolomyces salmoneus TaxID=183962 RepID=UPI00317B8F10
MQKPFPHPSPSPVVGELVHLPSALRLADPPRFVDPVVSIVLGAGCIGLMTAIEILKSGLPVLLLAQHLPGDSCPEYASSKAGAHHLSFAADEDWRQRYLDLRTFDKFWAESEDSEEGEKIGVIRLRQTEYYRGDSHLRLLEQLPNFRINTTDTLPDGIDHSVSFDSVTIEPSRYLPHLMKTFYSLGGVAARVPQLESLAEARRYAKSPLCLVNCTGLGASQLSDVSDTTVHPVRGQIVVLDCPWVKTGWTRQIGSLAGGEGGERTYVIPRASGEVVVGGTREIDDWETSPRPETTINILRRALEICPSLARPPHSTSPIELDSIIKSVGVGFRPTRDRGIRLESDTLSDGTQVLHNYGHGGYGWQCSWACAEEAARIVGEIGRKRSTRTSKL